jgi:carbon monoxide dehydrogenase subunit G
MASIRRDILIRVPPAEAWDAIRDVGALHTRLVPGFVRDTRLEPGARIVTFGSGRVLRERIVDCDDAARRLVWSIEDAWLAHHNASLQVLAEGPGARVVWIADLPPHEAGPLVAGFMEQGLATMRRTLEGGLDGMAPPDGSSDLPQGEATP